MQLNIEQCSYDRMAECSSAFDCMRSTIKNSKQPLAAASYTQMLVYTHTHNVHCTSNAYSLFVSNFIGARQRANKTFSKSSQLALHFSNNRYSRFSLSNRRGKNYILTKKANRFV